MKKLSRRLARSLARRLATFSEVGLLNKSFCLAAALGVIQFMTVVVMI
jgi:hypothetical protein